MTDQAERTYQRDGVLIVPWRIQPPGGLVVEGYDPSMAGRIINLQTPDELAALPDGTVVYTIFGERKVTGQDDIDTDTRFGRTAYGLLEP